MDRFGGFAWEEKQPMEAKNRAVIPKLFSGGLKNSNHSYFLHPLKMSLLSSIFNIFRLSIKRWSAQNMFAITHVHIDIPSSASSDDDWAHTHTTLHVTPSRRLQGDGVTSLSPTATERGTCRDGSENSFMGFDGYCSAKNAVYSNSDQLSIWICIMCLQ